MQIAYFGALPKYFYAYRATVLLCYLKISLKHEQSLIDHADPPQSSWSQK